MAKAILEYNLNDFEDEMAHKRAVKSLDMALAIWEIVHNVKKRVKNRIEFDELLDLSQYDIVDLVYEHIYDELKQRSINIDELIM
jgi:hypothetical protein